EPLAPAQRRVAAHPHHRGDVVPALRGGVGHGQGGRVRHPRTPPGLGYRALGRNSAPIEQDSHTPSSPWPTATTSVTTTMIQPCGGRPASAAVTPAAATTGSPPIDR